MQVVKNVKSSCLSYFVREGTKNCQLQLIGTLKICNQACTYMQYSTVLLSDADIIYLQYSIGPSLFNMNLFCYFRISCERKNKVDMEEIYHQQVDDNDRKKRLLMSHV